MSRYARTWIPGGSFFFTLALADRRSSLLVERVDDLRNALQEARRARPFAIVAVVVLPDHMHMVCTLPAGDRDYATRMGHFKAAFTRRVSPETSAPSRRPARRERGVWQRRYWEHALRDERDMAAHVDYIHFNPVKHGHAQRVCDWRWSSFHRYVARGILAADWGGTCSVGGAGPFGE